MRGSCAACWGICVRTGGYVAGALLALIGDAVFQLAPPYLVKVAIDQYIAGAIWSG